MPDDVQQTIRTRDLRLVDADGNDRAILTTDADGAVSLKMTGGNQNTQLSISVEKDGRILIEAVDAEGVQRIKLGMAGNGGHTELSFSERNRKPRMILMAEDKGPAGLFILDQYGKALFSTTP